MRPNKKALFVPLVTAFLLVLIVNPAQGSLVMVATPKLDLGDPSLHEVKLVIVTRHERIIYEKFIDAFIHSQYAQTVGITSADEIQVFNPTSYSIFYSTMVNPRVGADIAWGGGPTLFTSLAIDPAGPAIGPINDTDLLNILNTVVNDTISGASMKYYNDQGQLLWVANAISSFGFTINKKVIDTLGLPTPETWEDLASLDFFRSEQPTVAMGDAPQTTSNTRIYQIILQKYGWEKGWEILYRMAGNGAIFDGSVSTRQQVIDGTVAAAMTIDFYGFKAQMENPDCEYVIPKNASIVNGDPVALALNPAHPDAANAFLKFIFSQEGQALWLDPEINRLPIRADAFNTTIGQQREDLQEVYIKALHTESITFNEDRALSLEEAMRYHFQATITRVHQQLRTVWKNMVSGYQNKQLNDEQFNNLLKIYATPAITEDEAKQINTKIIEDLNYRNEKQSEWEDFKLNLLQNITSQLEELGVINPTVKEVPGFTITQAFYFLAIIAIPVMMRRKIKN